MASSKNKVKQAMGKNMVKNKNKKYIQQRKNSLAKGRTYSIYTEGRHLLDHCATLQE